MDLQTTDWTEVLDTEDLLARCLGNMEFACKILGKFCQRCDEDLVALEQAVSDDDAESVARLAHRLKGASANASARTLQKHASEIERAARGKLLTEVPASMESLKRARTRFSEAVSQFSQLTGSVQ